MPAIVFGTATATGAYGLGRIAAEQQQPQCTPQVVAAPAADSFDVRVFNGSEQPGSAAGVGKSLTQRGFRVAEVGNQPGLMSRYTRIMHGQDGTDQALYVATQFPGAQTEFDGRSGTSVSVVLGVQGSELVPVAPPPPPRPEQIKVNVYNATWRSGLASELGDALTTRGFEMGRVGNDPRRSFLPDDVAVIRYGPDGAPAARVLAQHVPSPRYVQEDRKGTEVDLVVGNGYTAPVPAASVPSPPPEPPKPTPTVTRCVVEADA